MTVDGNPVKLTSHEYRLLSYLMHHTGRIVSRGELTEHLYEQDFDRDSNTIEVFIGRLRKKLGVDIIQTVRGLGYLLERDPDQGVIRALPGSDRLAGRSIAVRLAVSAVFWSFAILLIAASDPVGPLPRQHGARLRPAALRLRQHLAVRSRGRRAIPDRELGPVGDPRFELPLSGWYWQVGPSGRAARGDPLARNPSSGRQLPSLVAPGQERRVSARSAAATALLPTTGSFASSSATSTSARTDATSSGSAARPTRSATPLHAISSSR